MIHVIKHPVEGNIHQRINKRSEIKRSMNTYLGGVLFERHPALFSSVAYPAYESPVRWLTRNAIAGNIRIVGALSCPGA